MVLLIANANRLTDGVYSRYIKEIMRHSLSQDRNRQSTAILSLTKPVSLRHLPSLDILECRIHTLDTGIPVLFPKHDLCIHRDDRAYSCDMSYVFEGNRILWCDGLSRSSATKGPSLI